MHSKQFYTTKEAAEYMKVTPNTIRNWDKNKKIPVYKDPKTLFRVYKKEDLDKMMLIPHEIEKTSMKINVEERKIKNSSNYHKILLRVPKEITDIIDGHIKNSLGTPSRTSVIIHILYKFLQDCECDEELKKY